MAPLLIKTNLTHFLYLSAFVLLLFSCRKDGSQGIAPAVVIESPVGIQTYTVLDTIRIRALVSHPEKIEFVRVAVVNSLYVTVLPTQEFIPEGKAYELNTEIVISNPFLESGKYFIRIKAGSGNQVTTVWAEIGITASEKVIESIMAVCSNPNGGFRLYDIGKNWEISQRLGFGGDYLGSAVDARTRMFYTCGIIYGGLNAWQLDDNQLRWSLPAVVNPPQPYFSQIYASGEEVFVATRDAFITGYDETGMSTFKSQQYTNGYFGAMIRHKSWLIAVFEPFNSTFNNLVVFNYPGGTRFQSLDFQGTVLKIVDYGTQGLLIFMNVGEGSAIYNYQFAENRLVRLKEFSLGPVSGISMSGEAQGFISVPGGIYWYRPGDNSLVKYLSVGGVSRIADDYLTNRLFVASGTGIEVYQLPAISPERTIELPFEILDLHLRYNK